MQIPRRFLICGTLELKFYSLLFNSMLKLSLISGQDDRVGAVFEGLFGCLAFGFGGQLSASHARASNSLGLRPKNRLVGLLPRA